MEDQNPSPWNRLRTWIEDWSRDDAAGPPNRLRRILVFWIRVARLFLRNRGPARASALAYTTLLALVPLLAISLSAATLFLPRKEEERRDQLLSWIEAGVAWAAPTLGLSIEDGSDQREKVAIRIISFVEKIHFRTIGAAATVGLLIVAIGLLRTVEVTFNDIWSVTRSRSLGVSIIYYWAILTLGPVIVIAAKAANYLQLLDGTSSTLAATRLAPLMAIFSFGVLPGVMCLVFGSLYWTMPNTRVPWQAALAGGAVASVLWTLNGKLSALYNTRILTANAIYGSLGVLPLFLVGLYFTWLIVLFGAQVACAYENRPGGHHRLWARDTTPVSRERAAVSLMTRIAAGFVSGAPPLSAGALSADLAISPELTTELLLQLVQARLLSETNQASTGFTPSRPLDRISIRDVLHAVRDSSETGSHETPDRSLGLAVQTALHEVAAAKDAKAEAFTLDSLIRQAQCGSAEPSGFTSRKNRAIDES